MSDSNFKDFLKTVLAAGVGAYAANKATGNSEKWAFDCHNSRCGHYEERSGNHQFKRARCPLCGWNIKGKKI